MELKAIELRNKIDTALVELAYNACRTLAVIWRGDGHYMAVTTAQHSLQTLLAIGSKSDAEFSTPDLLRWLVGLRNALNEIIKLAAELNARESE